MERRKFVKQSSIVCIGALAVGSLLASCAEIYYAQYTLENNKIRVSKTEFIDREYVVIKNDNLPAPIYVLKEGDVYSGVLMLCTHKNCEVSPASNGLHCPCHGSQFTVKGTVTRGPAEESLKKFKIETDDQYVYIT